MRIGHYFAFQGVVPGTEARISGHVKVPLRVIQAQAEMGLSPELITTEFRPGFHFGLEMPAGVPLHQITDGRIRDPEAGRWERAQAPLRTLRSIRELRSLVAEQQFDVLHVWGAPRTGEIGGLLARSGLGLPVVATVFAAPGRPLSRPHRALLGQLDAVIASTAYTQAGLEQLGVPTRLIRHGTVRDLRAEAGHTADGPRNRVLFWREMTESNGGDLCVEMFRRLAPQYPDITFTLALRESGEPEVEAPIPDLPNIECYRAPYPPGRSLATLMSQALCVVQPMRWLSMNPQLAVIESLAAGVAVVASDIASNCEYIADQMTGALVPPGDVSALVRAVEDLIADPELALALGRNAAAAMERYDWGQVAGATHAVYRDVVR
ncbi:MAG: glycosyltransferase family 4 protein [Candidatus Nanopelagicales bacterium]